MKFNHYNCQTKIMENKSNPQSLSSLGFFGIIEESFKITTRNAKLLGPLLVLVFLYFSQIDFLQKHMLAPIVEDFVLQLGNHPNILVQGFIYSAFDDKIIYAGPFEKIRVIVLVKLVITAISSIIILTFSVAIICASSSAYTAKVLDTKDLNSIFIKSWKRPLVTNFYMILVTSGIVFLYLISITITSMLVVHSWARFFIGVMTLSILVSYSYVAALWIVSVIVSILEEGFGGVKAIRRAEELMKGKRVQASVMMVLFVVAYGVVMIYGLRMSTDSIGIPFTNVIFTLLTLFVFVVYTIFYHEQKTCSDEKEGKRFYLPIAAGDA